MGEGRVEGKAGKKYMLHRGLPTVDLFSSATELDEEDLAQLVHRTSPLSFLAVCTDDRGQEVEDTDVIAVESTPASNSTSRLRDINPRLPPISRPHPATTATRGGNSSPPLPPFPTNSLSRNSTRNPTLLRPLLLLRPLPRLKRRNSLLHRNDNL
jgi:hypothetical protein